MDNIKFRGRCKLSKNWAYGDLIHGVGTKNGKVFILPITLNLAYIEHCDPLDGVEVIPETVGQFTSFLSKNNEEIYCGDIIYCLQPYRTTQTHHGDNIPNGSYTEPLEPSIKSNGGTVVFKDGCFQIETDNNNFCPIFYFQDNWDLQSIKYAIEYRKDDSDWFENPEEGDLQYLITEVANVEDANALIEYLNGFIIKGNIHD